jgi:hypothetical protein
MLSQFYQKMILLSWLWKKIWKIETKELKQQKKKPIN